MTRNSDFNEICEWIWKRFGQHTIQLVAQPFRPNTYHRPDVQVSDIICVDYISILK